ncbi:MAG: hypothetical protein U5L00_07220 [Desulfovermiculus sp.]|nr:hypothetical protein [Desulfovermiculus sp.]
MDTPEAEIGMNFLMLILYAFLAIIALILASVVIQEGSEILSSLANHILHLFDRATLNPHDSRGFGSFVQLLLIFGFVGWAINRFKR